MTGEFYQGLWDKSYFQPKTPAGPNSVGGQ
jgi:hypothetical protein